MPTIKEPSTIIHEAHVSLKAGNPAAVIHTGPNVWGINETKAFVPVEEHGHGRLWVYFDQVGVDATGIVMEMDSTAGPGLRWVGGRILDLEAVSRWYGIEWSEDNER
jgi:hypothetical protein